jgi:hypothetical protein
MIETTTLLNMLAQCSLSPAAQLQPLQSKLAEEKDAPLQLDDETLAATKRALESLFQEQSVVTMADVRIWLSNYAAAPKAQQAVRMRDVSLSSLLLGGGSILCVRYIPFQNLPFYSFYSLFFVHHFVLECMCTMERSGLLCLNGVKPFSVPMNSRVDIMWMRLLPLL